jgi:Ca2+-dependent lipid-binding protein
MVIEEKLRHKQMHLKQIIDEYTILKDKYDKGIKENKDEQKNAYGVATNAEVVVSVLEGIDLKPLNLSGRLDPFVSITLEGKEEVSHYKEDSCNPIWNEDLTL